MLAPLADFPVFVTAQSHLQGPEARAFIATELSPIYVLYSTHGNGGTGAARKVSAEDRTTKKHRMFGVGRDL